MERNSKKQNRYFGREIKNESLNIIPNLHSNEKKCDSQEEINPKNKNTIKIKEKNYIL